MITPRDVSGFSTEEACSFLGISEADQRALLHRVHADKYVRPGGVAPFSGFHWEPGGWVRADAAQPCERGVHACRVEDLPFWIHRELWQVELDDAVVEHGHKVEAPGERLVRRLKRWNEESERALAGRVGDYAASRPADPQAAELDEDGARYAETGRANIVIYIAAVADERAGGAEARQAERAWQTDWFRPDVLE